jgi:hypothetical protein
MPERPCESVLPRCNDTWVTVLLCRLPLGMSLIALISALLSLETLLLQMRSACIIPIRDCMANDKHSLKPELLKLNISDQSA